MTSSSVGGGAGCRVVWFDAALDDYQSAPLAAELVATLGFEDEADA